MKIKIGTLFILILCLCGCDSIHRNNYFIAGSFLGINELNKEQEFYFNVYEISKKEYDEAQGLNVVYDIYKKMYFSLDLFFYKKNNDKEFIRFINLKDYGTPISYKDENSHIITPCFEVENHKERPNYTIELVNPVSNELEAFIYLYNVLN